jgi:FecR protein
MRPGEGRGGGAEGPAPARLIDGPSAIAGALRDVRRAALPSSAEEGAAWRRVARERARGSRPRGWRRGGAAFAAAVAVVALVAFVHSRPRRGAQALGPAVSQAPGVLAVTGQGSSRAPAASQPPAAARAPAQPPASSSAANPAPAPAGQPPRIALRRAEQRLATGAGALADEATVEVAPGTVARASADPAWIRVTVERGEVALHVAKRVAGGPGFEVAAGPYRFRVLGTRFRVARRAPEGERDVGRVDLWVDEGRVAVTRGGWPLGVIEAGGHWAGRGLTRPAPRASAAVPAPASAATPPVPADGAALAAAPAPASAEPAPGTSRGACAEFAMSTATMRDAVACYLAEMERGGIATETALYEVARLRRDELDDPAGALEALELYRARFPRGMLRPEVDLSIIDLLAKLNRHHDALAEIGRVLREDPGRARAAELLLRRANIYRGVLGDCGRAEHDYAVVEQLRAPAVDDASFFRGACLQSLGRADEARVELRRYLDAADPRAFGDEARRRLDRLAR